MNLSAWWQARRADDHDNWWCIWVGVEMIHRPGYSPRVEDFDLWVPVAAPEVIQ